MEKIIKNYLKNKKRKTFLISEIEDIFEKDKYTFLGGFTKLVKVIKDLEKENFISSINCSKFYYKNPKIKSKWKILKNNEVKKWEDYVFIKYSKHLNLDYFKKNEKRQTKKNLKFIKNIHNFIENRDNRLFSSLEERSLEIFGDEKYLKKGNNILKKLKLTRFDNFNKALKMKKYSQMFVYFQKENSLKKTIIIVENQSIFFTIKKALENNIKIFNKDIDILIWGQGKRILNQLKMIDMLIDNNNFKIYYCGDIDPEGISIYINLKNKYSDLDISLFKKVYKFMINKSKGFNYNKRQVKNETNFKLFLKEFKNEKVKDEIKRLWDLNKRIPQEVITYEILKDLD
ncbi:MAG: Wadjet anti-phage system protein JetD domain-containing protein [Bacillota bacterium]